MRKLKVIIRTVKQVSFPQLQSAYAPSNTSRHSASVYKIVHRKTGKTYFGSTQYLKDRLMTHINGSASNRNLQLDMMKYGIEAFDFIEVKCFNNKRQNCMEQLSDARELESKLIARFRNDLLYNTRGR